MYHDVLGGLNLSKLTRIVHINSKKIFACRLYVCFVCNCGPFTVKWDFVISPSSYALE